MKSRKQVWIAALCLLSAIAIAAAFTTRITHVQAAKHVAPKSATSLAQPAVYLASPTLRNAMMDDDGPVRVGGAHVPGRTIFPPVEEFTLMPPNPAAGIDKTILTARFPEAQAAKLPSSIPMTLAKQNVILHRSATASNVFLTTLDFNWQRFIKEQAQRKVAASQGRKVAIFDGRKYVRTEKMQYVDPAQIQQALQSHQPIQFSADVLTGSSQVNVYPDHELMITSTAVVEDNANTFDACRAAPGTPNGAWTFNWLMQQIACSGGNNCTPGTTTAQRLAENMLLSMFSNFAQNQFVNSNPPEFQGFEVFQRTAIGQLNGFNGSGSGLLGNWPVDSGASCTFIGLPSPCPSLPMAPVRLDAIVNRIDLGQDGDPPFPQSGELRFVFSVTISPFINGLCKNDGMRGNTFNIILEYNVPGTIDPTTWATNWIALQTVFNPNQNDFNPNYIAALNNITNQVVMRNECTNETSCIAQIRTNEFLLRSGVNMGFWEQREFHLNGGSTPTLVEATIAQTPDPSFNTLGMPMCGTVNDGESCTPRNLNLVAQYINAFGGNQMLFQQTDGAAPPVPDDWNGNPFQGGSALQAETAGPVSQAYWNDNGITQTQEFAKARIDFSFNTCNSCHGRETNTGFVQVANRLPGAESGLSLFLTGCTTGGACLTNMSPPCATSLENMGEQTNGCVESVDDPANQQNGPTNFGDLLRRVEYLQNTCGTFSTNTDQCTGTSGGDLLLPFINKPIGVH